MPFARKVYQRIEQHGGVAVESTKRSRLGHVGSRGRSAGTAARAYRQSARGPWGFRDARIRLLYGVHGEGADCIDAELIDLLTRH